MTYLTLEEIQTELLSLLDVFDEFATSHSLRYSLDAGTLLGAVRHKGFIPWDDDLDVIMPRPDFERMLTLYNEIPEGYNLSQIKTDGATIPFAKFTDLKIGASEALYLESDRYLWIDIFPADGMSENEEMNLEAYEKIRDFQQKRMFQTYPSLNPVMNLVKKPLQVLMNLKMPPAKIAQEMTKIAREYSFETSEWCRDLVWANNPHARLRSEDFNNLVFLDFCGKTFPAIPHWHEYLESQYGDYLELPPEDQRKAHGMKAWYI